MIQIANYVVKPGTIIGYAINKDVIYLCFTVQNEKFKGNYATCTGIRLPYEDMKLVSRAIDDGNYSLDCYIIGAVIKDIRFKYVQNYTGKEVNINVDK